MEDRNPATCQPKNGLFCKMGVSVIDPDALHCIKQLPARRPAPQKGEQLKGNHGETHGSDRCCVTSIRQLGRTRQRRRVRHKKRRHGLKRGNLSARICHVAGKQAAHRLPSDHRGLRPVPRMDRVVPLGVRRQLQPAHRLGLPACRSGRGSPGRLRHDPLCWQPGSHARASDRLHGGPHPGLDRVRASRHLARFSHAAAPRTDRGRRGVWPSGRSYGANALLRKACTTRLSAHRPPPSSPASCFP